MIEMIKQIFILIKKHKLYIIAPMLIVLCFLGLLVVFIGPQAIIAIIYAGI